MSNLETITINEVEYVRADAVQVKPNGNRAVIVVDMPADAEIFSIPVAEDWGM